VIIYWQLLWPPLKRLSVTWPDIEQAVHDNTKQRFSLKKLDDETSPVSRNFSDWLIRANQGHSIKIESKSHLKPLVLAESAMLPTVIVHGTYCSFWPAIVESGGLKSMGRNHIHFATGVPEDSDLGVISGMRNDAELLIYIDVEATIKDHAMEWWVSENGVVLTEGNSDGLVPTIYFKKVVGRIGRTPTVGVLWEDGHRVADLPSGVRWNKPHGRRS
jgi:2'-phosphotransferase